ncbi:winged helix domain-containing protein [Sulfitobacter sp. BSw21498]|uniref:winged helix domain-containing protein n=1 Tax=Sulfitobacter sp. BSw21498 TaxID=664426 RepID=UPI00111073EF
MKVRVTLNLSEQSRTFELKGRLGWAMVQLVQAGHTGVTSMTRPAPRWSAYIFALRELGIPIETHTESHKGNYPGMHARYVLSCGAGVQFLETEM